MYTSWEKIELKIFFFTKSNFMQQVTGGTEPFKIAAYISHYPEIRQLSYGSYNSLTVIVDIRLTSYRQDPQ